MTKSISKYFVLFIAASIKAKHLGKQKKNQSSGSHHHQSCAT